MTAQLDESGRQEAFLMLVQLQDHGLGVEKSREKVASYYGIPISEVPPIEREGISKAWPPLEGSR